MSKPPVNPELVQWYEGLRAQATGQVPAATPRGLSLLLSSGLPAWMTACPTVTYGPPLVKTVSPDSGTSAHALDGMSVELVGVLTEMALGSLRRCSA